MPKAPIALKLDYAAVRSRTQLFEWATQEFSLPSPPDDAPQEFLKYLFDILAKRGKQYQVLEGNTNQIAPEVDRLINGFGGIEDGWKQVLGFHLFREGTGASVVFEKKHWWSRD